MIFDKESQKSNSLFFYSNVKRTLQNVKHTLQFKYQLMKEKL